MKPSASHLVHNFPIVLLATLPIFSATFLEGKALRIMVDGVVDEWPEDTHLYSDRNDENTLSLERIHAANDENYLFLRIDFNQELYLQEDNRITLYLDTDNNIASGMRIHGIGADWQWVFGEKYGALHTGSENLPAKHYELGLVAAPTVTSRSFEISIDRRKTYFEGNTIRIVVADETPGGDRLPYERGGLDYHFDDGKKLFPSRPFTMAKDQPSDLRILTWNVYEDGIFDPKKQAEFRRILQAIKPDIIGLEEVYQHEAEETLDVLKKLLPEQGRLQFARKFAPDLVLLSSYPMEKTYEIEGAEAGETNGAAVLELPHGGRLLLLIANPPCCGANRERQIETDAMMAFIRDAKSPGGQIDVPMRTPIIIIGDMDYVGDSQQPHTLIQGSIVNRDRFGAPFKPDWDNTALTDLLPRHTHEPLYFTYFDPSTPYLPGRLDYIVYSDSVIDAGNRFVLSTTTMPFEALTRYGLERNDTTTASDHLPVVADFILRVNDGRQGR